MNFSMLSKKVKIIIIAGVSVAVLGLGLGLGLSGSSSSDSTYAIRLPNGLVLNDKAYEQGYYEKDGKKYMIKDKGDGSWDMTVPEQDGLRLSGMSLIIPSMFDNKKGKAYKGSSIWGEGKNGIYEIDYMDIGAVKVTPDRRILAGYKATYATTASENSKKITGYELDDKIKTKYPQGFEIGSFDETGGGINMLKLQQFREKMDTSITAGVQKTRFSLYANGDKVNLATWNPDERTGVNRLPSAIGVVVTSTQSGSQGKWIDEKNKPKAAASERNKAVEFHVREFKKRDGSDYTITLPADQDVTATKPYNVDVNLSELYFPVKIIPGSLNHPILGYIEFKPDGKLHLVEGLKATITEFTPTFKNDDTFTLPEITITLSKTTFYEENYASSATRRLGSKQLLISVDEDWLPYFQSTANDPYVKDFARQNEVTIRFKVGSALKERDYINTVSVQDKRAAEVFFLPADSAGLFNTNNKVAPLKSYLLKNLEDKVAFRDGWRASAKIKAGNDKGEYGFYPFNVETQIIAYNKDYLPNGLDFKKKPFLVDHLTQTKTPDAKVIGKRATNPPAEDLKKGLLMAGHLIISGPAWAYNYYKDLQKDQVPGEQDIVWPRKSLLTGENVVPKKSYWSVLADPGLKDDHRFQKFVDHYKNANPSHQNDSANSEYDKKALFNGHVGAIVIGPWWIRSDWRNGEFIGDDSWTPQKKKEFAENKIGFQSVPNGLNSGWFAAMTSTLKNEPNKQKVAERFLNLLLSPFRATEFAQGTSSISARKDAVLLDADKITKGYADAMVKTPILLGRDYLFQEIWAPYNNTVNAINSKNITYEEVANKFKEALLSDPNVESLTPPEPA